MSNTPLPQEAPVRFSEENKKAEDLIAAGELSSAARILVDIIGKDGGNFAAFNNIGIISWMQKAWQDSYAMFKKAVELKPDFADALINLFDAALKLRRVKDALPCFDRALELQPACEDVRIIRDSIVEQGDEIYRSERGLVIGVYNPRVDEAQALIAEGKLYLAMEKLLKINDEEGPSSEVFSGLGVISYYQERYSDAFTLFLESIKLNPTSRDNFLNFLDAAKSCDRVKEAKDVYQLYLKTFPFLSSIAEEFENS
jgi:tetratricopeptide (TPR) repeat protein